MQTKYVKLILYMIENMQTNYQTSDEKIHMIIYN